MSCEWIDEYCLQKRGVTFEYKPDWEASLYKVGGKTFAMLGADNAARRILTCKCEPAFGELLREGYTDIRPGYHTNKLHWISADLAGNVPDAVMKDIIDMSYRLVAASLPKTERTALLQD